MPYIFVRTLQDNVYFFPSLVKLCTNPEITCFFGYRRLRLLTLCNLILVLRVLIIALRLYIRFSTAFIVFNTE